MNHSFFAGLNETDLDGRNIIEEALQAALREHSEFYDGKPEKWTILYDNDIPLKSIIDSWWEYHSGMFGAWRNGRVKVYRTSNPTRPYRLEKLAAEDFVVYHDVVLKHYQINVKYLGAGEDYISLIPPAMKNPTSFWTHKLLNDHVELCKKIWDARDRVNEGKE